MILRSEKVSEAYFPLVFASESDSGSVYGRPGDFSMGSDVANRSVRSIAHILRTIDPEAQRRVFKRKKGRAYHRIVSGLTRAHAHGERLRFLTLTSANKDGIRTIRRHFQVLRKRIEHRFHFKAEYCSISTREGRGVLHLIFWGRFIPYQWLKEAWSEIHGAWNVDIRMLKNRPRKLANYLCSQYLTAQSFERLSWSWGWVFRGFAGLWKSHFAVWYKSNRLACLRVWNDLIIHFGDSCLVQDILGG